VESPYPHIACCIDDSEASRLALDEARRLRSLAPGRLSLVHVAQWPPPYAGGFGVWLPDPELLFSQARDWLTAQAAAVPEAEAVFLEGYPAAEACEWALEAGVDLMVAASHRGAAARITLGSFAHYLIHHAPCPVLIARPKGPRNAGQRERGAASAREPAG
jgi:universal stress protein A